MSYVHFSFVTSAFKDGAEVYDADSGQIAGHGLAQWLRTALSVAAFEVSDVWEDDHGWDFDVRDSGSKLQVACSLNDSEQADSDGHIVLGPKASDSHPVVVAVRKILEACRDIDTISVETKR